MTTKCTNGGSHEGTALQVTPNANPNNRHALVQERKGIIRKQVSEQNNLQRKRVHGKIKNALHNSKTECTKCLKEEQ